MKGLKGYGGLHMSRAKKQEHNKAEAARLFFSCNESVKSISAALGLHVQTIRQYLRSHEDYHMERQRRKLKNQDCRKLKKKQAANASCSTGRLGDGIAERETLKRQHIRDVGILSSEKF
jgi:hypothetical protein